MDQATAFRTCAHTGLRVHRAAERLIKAHAVAGVLAILAGGIAAVLVLLTRWPAVHLLDPALYYRALTFHGINMLIFWIIFFEVAILYFAAPVVLGSRVAWPRVGWLGFGLMAAGAVLIDVAILQGGADVLFAVGALLGVLNFFATLVVARAERTYEGSIPLVTFGALTAAIIALVTLAHGAIIYIPTWLWSMGVIQHLDAGMYRLVWWGLGHPSQQINVSAMVAVWYLLATLTVGATPVNEKVSRWAFVLYILFINLASAHHLLVDPQVSPAWKIWNTSYGMYLAVLAGPRGPRPPSRSPSPRAPRPFRRAPGSGGTAASCCAWATCTPGPRSGSTGWCRRRSTRSTTAAPSRCSRWPWPP